VAQVLDAAQASALLGIAQPRDGFWFPRAGWLRPAALCRTLLDHPAIRLLEFCGEVALEQTGSRWRAIAGGVPLAEADCAVAAPGSGVRSLQPFGWLPVQAIRGQVTHLPTTGHLEHLRAALCHEGYIAPARAGGHCVGATFDAGGGNPVPTIADHRRNLESLAAAVPGCRAALDAVDHSKLQGRVGYRCASPDYLPVVGPAPDLPGFLEGFGSLRKNARHPIARRGSYLPGLWLTTAHGSRGLTSTPLAGELLASLICREPPPVSRALCRALAPARFIIRDLTRNRI
jgi:tRNA 5-methylaminomethyl-2-thiouridine biosynthesis bifunctional protein